MNESNLTGKRDTGLDFIKVFATFAVLKLHVGWIGYGEFSGSIIQYMCGCAVPLFFMVSGALTLNKKVYPLNYYINKVKRILILILEWSVPLYVVVAIKDGKLENPVAFYFKSFFQDGYLWHFWFLWALAILYLLSPILIRMFESKLMRNYTTLALLITLLIIFSMNITIAIFYNEKPFEVCVPQSLRIWSHITYYWLGGVVYECLHKKGICSIKQESVKRWMLAGMVILWVTLAFVQYVLCRLIMNITSPEYMFDCPAIVVLNVCIFTVFCCYQGAKIIDKIARLIPYSLGIYIVHPFVIVIANKILPWETMGWPVRWILLAIVSMAITVVLRKIPYLNRLICL